MDFEVLIVGGGPAGLLLARKLAPEVRILLIEKKTIGETAKFWLTIRERLTRHGLADCIAFSSGKVLAGTFLGAVAPAYGDFTVVDERRLLDKLAGQCRGLGVAVLEGCELLNISWDPKSLKAETTHGTFSSRLLIDATGGLSPVAASFRLHRLRGFFSVYGAHLCDISLKSLDIVGAHVLRLGYPPPILELIPTGPSSAFCIIFVATRRLVEPRLLAAQFHEHLRNNPFFSGDEIHVADAKFGAIPIGNLRRRRLPGIMPFGEAALVQPPLLGTAFNEVLEYLDLCAASVGEALANKRAGPVNVNVAFPWKKTLNDHLQAAMVKHILDGGVERVEAIVSYLREMGPEGAYRLYSGQFGVLDVLRTLPSALPFLMASKSKPDRS